MDVTVGFLGLSYCRHLQDAEEKRLFVMLWALWLHCNKIFFKVRAASVDGVVHDMEGFVSQWFRRT